MSVTKVDILAFGAHPDDVECAAAGTLLKHIATGKTVAIVDLTAGEMGSFGNPETRRLESQKAAKVMGVKHREQLGISDGNIENSEANRIRVIQAIRKYQPDIVLANAVHDRHPDHANAAKLVADSCFLSGLKKKETSLDRQLQPTWRPKVVYHYIQDYFLEPDFVVDITLQMEKKVEAIRTFDSQFVVPKGNEPTSLLSLLDQVRSMNSIYGRPIGAAFAEGFTVNRYIGVKDFYQLI